ncbi:MAG: GldG family protein [Gammaproteobacteria bacterium]|nr:GldG family protein [Gammaproteobacteria bacterium]
MEVTRKSRLILRFQSAIFFILFTGIIGLLGWLAMQNNIRSDWTHGARNSLSKDTLQLLNEIEQPVSIRSYQPDHPLYKKRAEEIFSRYQQNAKNLSYRLVDHNLDIDLAKADGITREGQSSIRLNDKSEIINDLSEQSISNALIRLYRNKTPLLHFLSGHGERDYSSQQSIGYLSLNKQLASKGIKIKGINLLTENLDDKINDTLVIAAPENKLVAGEIKKIQEFIELGGNLLWLQDPSPRPELQAVADKLQMHFIDGVAINNDQNLRSTLGISHPAVLPIISYKLHPITEKMDYFTLFITAAAMQVNQDSTWKHTSLLLTEGDSWTETDGFILDVHYDEDKGDIKGPHSIGLALERKIKNNDKTQRVVIIGDSDFIANNNLGQGANLSFIVNTINWLTEDDNLMSILPQASPDTRLELDNLKKAVISISFLIVLPVLFFGSGIYIWLKRKQQ